jgi:hypothetical protein
MDARAYPPYSSHTLVMSVGLPHKHDVLLDLGIVLHMAVQAAGEIIESANAGSRKCLPAPRIRLREQLEHGIDGTMQDEISLASRNRPGVDTPSTSVGMGINDMEWTVALYRINRDMA